MDTGRSLSRREPRRMPEYAGPVGRFNNFGAVQNLVPYLIRG